MISLNKKAKKLAIPALKKMQKARFLERLTKKDTSLWKKDAENKKIIANALGWLEVPNQMIKNLPEINSFTDFARKKFTACVVLGMGGSSLAPEVFRAVFEQKKDYPKLYVLDTTHPLQIAETEKKLNLKKTLFIFASKSGTTTEPNWQFDYFRKKLKNPQNNFIAITDKNTPLEKLAKRHKFIKIFINPSDIGGRFAALSYFGLVPASLMGVDIKKLLLRAVGKSLTYNPALLLGAAMADACGQSIDKLTLVMPEKIKPLGLWIEQLVAESTGKENKGIIPVISEPIKNYSKDRIFVNFTFEKSQKTRIENPQVTLYLKDTYDLGAQFYLWELATAAAGFILKINPFNQPDVEQSKVFMRNILKKIPKNPKKIIYSKAIGNKNLSDAFYRSVKKGSYAAILAYLNPEPKIHKLLQNLRKKITTKTGIPTVLGYGPRYLHSTGQLFKGGRNEGIFIIIEGSGEPDIKIDKKRTFGRLISAQSMGDFKALDAKKRKAVKITIPHPAGKNLKKVINMF